MGLGWTCQIRIRFVIQASNDALMQYGLSEHCLMVYETWCFLLSNLFHTALAFRQLMLCSSANAIACTLCLPYCDTLPKYS